MPAAAVIPAPIAYIKVVAVKKLSIIIAGQPIGDCSIRVYRSFYYTKEYHTGYFPLYCYYD